jgi:isopenicillin N synthase-like dioxygenase
LQACHENILLPLLSLIATILELPEEETLRIVSYEKTEEGKYDEPGECQYRWTHYGALSEEEQKNNPIYAGAHEDFNLLTFHFRQP